MSALNQFPAALRCVRVLASYQNSVFNEITASRSGMTSEEKYAPRSNTWPESDGMKCFQILSNHMSANIPSFERPVTDCRNSEVAALGPGARTLCGYISLFPILGMMITSLGKVSRIFSTIIRFESKISLGVRGIARSISCLIKIE